jgi:hypothetical protein
MMITLLGPGVYMRVADYLDMSLHKLGQSKMHRSDINILRRGKWITRPLKK